MKIILIGASGTIGREIHQLLRKEHEVVAVSRSSGDLRADLEDKSSLKKLFDECQPFDAVICVAGTAKYKSFSELSDEDYELGLRNKLMGQVHLVQAALEGIRPSGVIVLTGGVASRKPFASSGASISMVNAALEGFIRAAAKEMPKQIRLNLVAPGWATETLEAFNMDTGLGIPAADMAEQYLRALSENISGKVFDAD